MGFYVAHRPVHVAHLLPHQALHTHTRSDLEMLHKNWQGARQSTTGSYSATFRFLELYPGAPQVSLGRLCLPVAVVAVM